MAASSNAEPAFLCDVTAHRKLAVNRIILIVLCLLAANGIASAQSAKVITGARANGTYRHNDSVIRILALGHHKLRIQLDLIYEYKSKYGQEANVGQAIGEAVIEDDVANFHPLGFPVCNMTIKFVAGNKIRVTQDREAADCGFGQHVFANGTYAKVKSGRPKFEIVQQGT
jgi:hypothetical protein